MQGPRRLVVLRHAKSAWPPDVDDHDRPLAGRGRRDAPAAGRWLRDADCVPDLVVCSTAVRARQTWELAAAQLPDPPPVRHDPRLYDADPADVLAVVRETPDDVRTLLLVGHNPAAQEVVLRCAAQALGDALDRAREKFPTSAIAVLAQRGTWSAAGPRTALLTDFAVPRGARPRDAG
ncbi:histidine phosphatase family protein [Streptomyces sp. CT34]|uniref:SixA phosphatase family protein n=1 Tax=Streptomyces sp. CT34 TaxID=1553907 RepID=UPI0005BC7E06|nr:histidine phosphatase family protein [Streptomyces sp. CT34]